MCCSQKKHYSVNTVLRSLNTYSNCGVSRIFANCFSVADSSSSWIFVQPFYIIYAYDAIEAHYVHSLCFQINSINFTMNKTLRHKTIALSTNLNNKLNIFYATAITFSTCLYEYKFFKQLEKRNILYVWLNNFFLLCWLIPILTVERFCNFFYLKGYTIEVA